MVVTCPNLKPRALVLAFLGFLLSSLLLHVALAAARLHLSLPTERAVPGPLPGISDGLQVECRGCPGDVSSCRWVPVHQGLQCRI